MKKTFIETLIELAEKDKNIYLLTGDLGFSAFEKFAEKFPERFIDCGVAEQNMIGLAAGLALEGKKPYVYSIIPFIAMRCLEQIRNDVCYQNLDVKIVGIGTGFSYGSENFTHYAIEDISILKSLPNIKILSPGDSVEAKQLIEQSYLEKVPTYIRLSKSEVVMRNIGDKIVIGQPSTIKDGADGTIITTGSCLETWVNVVEKLEKKGISLKLISLHTIKPIDEKLLIKEIKGKIMFTLEEHKLIGGLGSTICEILSKHNLKNIIIKNIGIPDECENITGEQSYLKKIYKIDADGVYEKIIDCLKNGK